MLKGKLARLNLTLKKKNVKKLTEDAFESISPEDWASCCRHVKDVEKRFYATDIAVDDQVDRLVIAVTSSDHYANMSVQYTAIFHSCKNDNFQTKIFDIFLIFAQNMDCGYTLESPQRGGSNEYPQSMFWSKNKKIM